MYQIQSKPTFYSGVRFRSQLEANWAAFFDVAGMPWEYEPISLPGWVPDFRLFGRFLCEVKPIFMDGFGAASDPWVKKAVRNTTALIFGDKPRGALACMVSARDGLVSSRTVFFDPDATFKMTSVSDDGGNHPLRNSAEFVWRSASSRLRNSNRISMSVSA